MKLLHYDHTEQMWNCTVKKQTDVMLIKPATLPVGVAPSVGCFTSPGSWYAYATFAPPFVPPFAAPFAVPLALVPAAIAVAAIALALARLGIPAEYLLATVVVGVLPLPSAAMSELTGFACAVALARGTPPTVSTGGGRVTADLPDDDRPGGILPDAFRIMANDIVLGGTGPGAVVVFVSTSPGGLAGTVGLGGALVKDNGSGGMLDIAIDVTDGATDKFTVPDDASAAVAGMVVDEDDVRAADVVAGTVADGSVEAGDDRVRGTATEAVTTAVDAGRLPRTNDGTPAVVPLVFTAPCTGADTPTVVAGGPDVRGMVAFAVDWGGAVPPSDAVFTAAPGAIDAEVPATTLVRTVELLGAEVPVVDGAGTDMDAAGGVGPPVVVIADAG